MKNIHVLPSSKPIRLVKLGFSDNLHLYNNPVSFKTFERSTQNIYITNNEIMKNGDWYLDNNVVYRIKDKKHLLTLVNFKNYQKIILTTNQKLIKDGVQAIDDGFLEWFINNQNCEFVNIVPFDGYNAIKGNYSGYEIIIPKEELNNIN